MNAVGASTATGILLVGGGRGAEAPISLDSARAVYRALRDSAAVAVTPALWRRDGRLVTFAEGVAEPFEEARWSSSESPVAESDVESVDRLAIGIDAWMQRMGGRECLLFPALHGVDGEDGALQGLCESIGLAYAFSGVAASAVGMDKVRTREALAAAGVQCAPGVHLQAPIDVERATSEIDEALGFPVFAKVASSGSSLGVQRCEEVDALRAFLAEHRLERLVVEARILGAEFSVPVLGNTTRSDSGALESLSPISIRPKRDWFDHQAKYDAAQCDEVVAPDDVDDGLLERMRQLACASHRALGCDGVSRTDFLIGPEGPIVLEVNTIPGLTEQSLLPQCAAHDGLSFESLLLRIVRLGLERAEALR